MSIIFRGDRIGKTAILRPSCDAIIFDPIRQKVLLTRRSDNGQWCFPSGSMDPGESAVECCAREVLEETGLVVEIGRLIGVYTTPHWITEYADGNRLQWVTFIFEAKPTSGELRLSDETTEVGYFSPEQMKSMDVMEPIFERVADALTGQVATYVK